MSDAAIANPGPDTQADETDMLAEMRDHYHKDAQAVEENHVEALDDLRFRAGDQWNRTVKNDREKTNRPCLTVDYISQHVRQITGDIRLNKPAIKVRPTTGGANKDTAEIMTGIIRNIEQESMAASVYARAADNAATCGEGAFRITTVYAGEDSFDQDIRIERINNPLAVIWDRNAKEPTMIDARRCWVLERYARDAFEATWPDASTEDFEASYPEDWVSDWYTTDTVLVAEYWVRTPVMKTIAQLATGEIIPWDTLSETEKAAYIQRQGGQPVRERRVESSKVERYVVNGSEILEGPELWPGHYIPIIPVFGEEVYVGEELIRRGIVRMAKDPQRMINYHNSAAVEIVSLAPKSPFVGTVKQFEGLEAQWEQANIENRPYMSYNPDPAAPGAPQRQPQAQVPAALLSLKQESVSDLNNSTGIHPASLGMQSAESSGKAILARERQGDVGSFVYTDNLTTAINYAGRQLVDLIPKVYDGQRAVRILGEDDAEKLLTVNEVVMTEEGQQIINDLTNGKYDVKVSTGPSFSTKRQESAESILQFIQTNPQDAALVMDLLVDSLDWPNGDEISKRFRQVAIGRGIVEPDPDKGDEQPMPEQPSPDEMAAAEKDAAAAEKSRADAEKSAAEAEGQRIENAQAVLELMQTDGSFNAAIGQIVQAAVADVLDMERGPAQQPAPPMPPMLPGGPEVV